ncbi:MAG: leucyl aminopeptidase, partial [Acidimicrobiales bacterium]
EGASLGSYRYIAQKSKPERVELKKLTIVSSTKKVNDAVKLGAAIGDGVALARDLVNEPGGSLTPPKFASTVQRMARRVGLKVKVMDKAAIEKAKLGGLIGVNKGSTVPARFVELTYEPDVKAKGTIAFVGKGITFDSGGLSIKTGNGMMTMKCDMGGAAAVVGAMSVLPISKPPVRVRAYLPMTDNMLGGDAQRPGDVVKLRNGKTMEILNTDAEGRIVLADALSLASEAKPDAIVDLATLTGACMVALGPKIAGLMGNDDGWVTQVGDAASNAGERMWHLPLPADYKKMYDSSVADMKNITGPHGAALTAGLILSEFVADNIPWVHLDIAGPAFSDSSDTLSAKGATGFGVRTLVRLASDFTKTS